jgi:DNA ligase-1
MRLFTELYNQLDQTNRTSEKIEALEKYFATAPPEDAAWGLYFLTGNRLRRAVNSTLMRAWAAEQAGVEPWLMDECYDSVGDLAETIALLVPNGPGTDMPLHELVESRLVPLTAFPEADKRAVMERCWREMNCAQCLVWHKLAMGGFRVGVSKTLVVRALAKIAGVNAATMAHRMMGKWQPTAEDFTAMISGSESGADPAKPYPFFLAYPIDGEPASLGNVDEYFAEWKWDGIRSQLIHRGAHVMVWSRGEELITDRFPEIAGLGELLPDGTVLDGEILAWANGHPLPFQMLQTRITRKNLTPKIMKDVPVIFVAYDVMEWAGNDVRTQSLEIRRGLLESLSGEMAAREVPFMLSPQIIAAEWSDLALARSQARERGGEGLML